MANVPSMPHDRRKLIFARLQEREQLIDPSIGFSYCCSVASYQYAIDRWKLQSARHQRQREYAAPRRGRAHSRLLPGLGSFMSEIEAFRDRATQARRMAAYTSDRRTRVILEVLSDEIEQKIIATERRFLRDNGAES